MTLIELSEKILKSPFDSKDSNQDFGYSVEKNILDIYKEKILNCDEFSKIKELQFIELPYLENKNKEIVEAKSILLTETTKFTGMNYIYRLSSSSEFFDPNISFKTIKDGIDVYLKYYKLETQIENGVLMIAVIGI